MRTPRRASVPPSERSPTLRTLLRVDCTGALVVGVAVLAASGWLASLYAVPRVWIVGLGVVNVAYGLYSLSLVVRPQPPRVYVGALAAANMGWAVACGVLAMAFVGRASVFGLAHLVVEGAFVGVLGAMEWRRRGCCPADSCVGPASPSERKSLD